MTQTQTPRIDYAAVRPGMTVQTYSGAPIEVTAVRHLVRRLGEGRGWTRTVALSGWFGGRYVENCYQLPERRTGVLHVDHGAMNLRTLDTYDAVLARRTHSYSTRYLTLDLNIRIDVTRV